MKRILLLIMICLFASGCAELSLVGDRSETKYEGEIGYEIYENLGTECSNDDDCETPMEYLVRSSCPFDARCIADTCQVVCPDYITIQGDVTVEDIPEEVVEEAYDSSEKAAEIAVEYVKETEEYIEYEGSNLKIEDLLVQRCPGCFDVKLSYLMKSMKDSSVTDKAKITIQLRDWEVVDVVQVFGGLEKNYCTEESKSNEMCTFESNPVCGHFIESIQCIKEPCAQDYGNPCSACASGNVEYWTEGSCFE